MLNVVDCVDEFVTTGLFVHAIDVDLAKIPR